MIIFTCPTCNRVAIPKVTPKQTMIDIPCKCEAIWRLQLTQLHEGKPVPYEKRELEIAYTYDADGTRVTLSDVRRQAKTN